MQITVEDFQQADFIFDFVSWTAEKLKISPNELIIGRQDDLEGANGMFLDLADDVFMVLVKTTNRTLTDICVTIAHELIHVKQYLFQNLGKELDNCQDIPYMERWWEIEAFHFSKEFVKEYAECLRPK